MDNLDLLGLDIGKKTFHLIGHDAKGKELLRKKFNRNRLLEFDLGLQIGVTNTFCRDYPKQPNADY